MVLIPFSEFTFNDYDDQGRMVSEGTQYLIDGYTYADANSVGFSNKNERKGRIFDNIDTFSERNRCCPTFCFLLMPLLN